MKNTSRIFAQTFSEFDLIVDNETVLFERARSKELLAYLINTRGRSITRLMAFSILWGDERQYDRPMQKQLDVVIRSMRKTLIEYKADEIFELKDGRLRVLPEKFDCDLYRFLENDKDARFAYQGVYMKSYNWAKNMEEKLSEL